ncbi:MAG TPA: four helix bundle protein [Thermodesulfobacteriota bacterium]
MRTLKRFEDLEIWQEARTLAVMIYGTTAKGKFGRDIGLKGQIQRAAVSIASNIAEGFERKTNKDFIKFLYYAKGSTGEVRTQLHIARDLEYLSHEDFNEIVIKTDLLSAKIGKLISYLTYTHKHANAQTR